jgi:predicted MFS family arabinose efflux permease
MRLPLHLYILASGAFALIATELGVIPLLPAISQGLHVSVSAAGWLLCAFALSVALAGPWMTLGFARFEPKRCLCFVLAVFVATNVASALAPDFGWLLALRVVPALVHPVFWSIAMSMAAGSVDKANASRAVSVVFAGMSAGIVLGIPLASVVSGVAGWRMAFALFAVLNLVALVAHLAWLPSLPAPPRKPLGGQLRVLARPVLWTAVLTQVLLTAGAFAVYGFIAPFLTGVSHAPGWGVSAALFVFGVMGVGGTLLAGRALGRDADRTVSFVIPVLAVVFAVLWAFGGQPVVALLLVPAWGLVHAFVVPASQALVLRAGPDTPEFSNALFNAFGNVGITVGTALAGFVVGRLGIAPLPLAGVALLLLAAVAFAIDRLVRGAATAPIQPTSHRI